MTAEMISQIKKKVKQMKLKMNKRKKNIQYVLDTENHFYYWVLNLEFKHSKDEYKLNPSEMRFLLEVNDFNEFLRFFILNARFSKADKKVVFEKCPDCYVLYETMINKDNENMTVYELRKKIKAVIGQ